MHQESSPSGEVPDQATVEEPETTWFPPTRHPDDPNQSGTD